MQIEVEGLARRFGEVSALAQVSFRIERGSRIALVGPNGSGKSTLNRILMGLLAYEGRVRLEGRCPFQERVAVARALAYVPQLPPQLGAPVAELVAAVARVRELPCERVADTARGLDLDLAGVARRPFRSLSGGMKQKLLIALAFAARPSLLIMDEPTASLDAQSRERFFEGFHELAADTTLLLCSHRLDEIRPFVEHVLVLESGRLTYDGPVASFLARCARAAIEVWVDSEQASPWLLAHGFRHSAAGVWRRTVDTAEKLKLLPELESALEPWLVNLNARDLELLEPTSAAREVERG
jgi:ABC-2 type transport system ATP-binding protein